MLPALFKPDLTFGPSRWRALGPLSTDVDRLFDRFFAPRADAGIVPYRVDVWEDEDHVYLAADVPGLSKEDLDISVEDGILTIAGERKTESQRKEDDYHLRERRYGKFERRFRLPETVDTDDVQANLKDGVLTISLNRHEQVKAKKIDVK